MAEQFSPCVDQTDAQIAGYYATAEIGSKAAVRVTSNHAYQVIVSEIIGRARGRVTLKGARVWKSGSVGGGDGSYVVKTGTSVFHPWSQVRLIVPTDEVLSWAALNPRGLGGISHRRHTFPWIDKIQVPGGSQPA